VAQLWRFPVKSTDGAAVVEVRIDRRGAHADRLWAVRDLDVTVIPPSDANVGGAKSGPNISAKGGHSVVKPLYGAKGRNVFMIDDADEPNLAQIAEAVLLDGYAVVQEFVGCAEDGDARIFLVDGQILERDGQLAAFRRVPTSNDPRANDQRGRALGPSGGR